jgi:hypothetical protein
LNSNTATPQHSHFRCVSLKKQSVPLNTTSKLARTCAPLTRMRLEQE